MAKTYIYFIGASTGPIKIGKATNLQRRLSGIQTGHPDKLEVLGAFRADPRAESAIHRRFSKYSLRGEWFERSPEILRFIEEKTYGSEEWVYADHIRESVRREILEEERVRLNQHLMTEVKDSFVGFIKPRLHYTWRREVQACQDILRSVRLINERLGDRGAGLTIDEHAVLTDLRRAIQHILDEDDWRFANKILLGEKNEKLSSLLTDRAQRFITDIPNIKTQAV